MLYLTLQYQNIPSDMCAQQRFRSTSTFTCILDSQECSFFMLTMKTELNLNLLREGTFSYVVDPIWMCLGYFNKQMF